MPVMVASANEHINQLLLKHEQSSNRMPQWKGGGWSIVGLQLRAETINLHAEAVELVVTIASKEEADGGGI